jgi:hypothetical protein
MSGSQYDEVLNALRKGKASLRCSHVESLLTSLGFEVRHGRAGHRVFDHNGIPAFHGSNYDCGHGRDPELKKPYVYSLIRTLSNYEAEIREFLGEKK